MYTGTLLVVVVGIRPDPSEQAFLALGRHPNRTERCERRSRGEDSFIPGKDKYDSLD
jgi:hypothetical protein